MHNEEESMDAFFSRVESVMAAEGYHYEIVCINDGSRDRTLEGLIAHRRRNPAVKIVDFSRNFGKEAALTAGIDFSTGAAVIPIDADLQDPPELIPQLVEKWREGYHCVYATRADRTSDSYLKRKTAERFYRSFNAISEIAIPYNAGDFRLIDRKVVDTLKRMPERNRFMKGIFSWVGFKQTSIEYARPEREQGESAFGFWRLWNFALDGFTSFSTVPLRIWSYIGVFISGIAVVYAVFIISRTLMQGIDVPGYASLLVVTLILGGLQLFTLGVFGEYLGRVYLESKNRPLYLVNSTYGMSQRESETDPTPKIDPT
ncbi:MAG: glycosyltransferase family 2 protein [Symploca sp. SIO2D2]|nr:glycosyltransferase family 2 protein [Symploca sp. SIO2D2]